MISILQNRKKENIDILEIYKIIYTFGLSFYHIYNALQYTYLYINVVHFTHFVRNLHISKYQMMDRRDVNQRG